MCVQVPCVYILHTASSVTERNTIILTTVYVVTTIGSVRPVSHLRCGNVIQSLNPITWNAIIHINLPLGKAAMPSYQSIIYKIWQCHPNNQSITMLSHQSPGKCEQNVANGPEGLPPSQISLAHPALKYNMYNSSVVASQGYRGWDLPPFKLT